MGHSGSFWSGFILGGLAGAAWALLNAPQSGEKTRLQIQQRGVEFKTRLEDLTGDFQERGIDAVREKLPMAGETGRPVTVAVEEGVPESPEGEEESSLSSEMNGPATVTVQEKVEVLLEEEESAAPGEALEPAAITVQEETQEPPEEEEESADPGEKGRATTVTVDENDQMFPEEEQKTLPGEEQEPERLLPEEED